MDSEEVIIPSGTFLYRGASKACVYNPSHIKCTRRECSNTGKTGIYFGNYLLVALAIATELNRDLELGVFVTTKDIKVKKGKYTFREIHPERFAAFYAGEEPHPNTLLPNEDIGHFNNTMAGLLYNHNRDTSENFRQINTIADEGELFITSLKDLSNIKLISTYKIDLIKFREIISQLELSEIKRYDINYWLRKGVLKHFYCNTSRKNRNKTRRL